MEDDEYAKLAATEDRMWWFRALHRNLLRLLARFAPEGTRVLDAGCGTGGFLRRLGESRPDLVAVGVDVFPPAAAVAHERSRAPVCAGSVATLPFVHDSFSAIVSADILCHRRVDPDQAIAEAFRCLADGGAFVVHVPAYTWLWGPHDERVHTARRFTRRRLAAALAAAGFRIAYAGYWNTLPFPLMVLRRKVLRGFGDGSDVREYPPWLEVLFNGMMAVESALLDRGWRLPFGGSVLVVGVKDAKDA